MSIKIGLDAGHGLKTPGKQTPDGIKEWTLNDKVADKITAILKDYDVEIIRTDNNEGNTDESDISRLNKSLNSGLKAFVSIHHNAFTGTWNNATGVEVWTDRNPTTEDVKLANCIYSRLVKNTGLRGRGIKKENWTVINQNKIPAVLVEGGFMDGTNDYKYIISDAGQTAYAKAVAEGLIEFLGLTKKKATTTTTSKFTGKISGYNTTRWTNYLVIYNKGSNTGTNQWGTEVAVNSDGVATCSPVYGKGKMAIPSGGYVISGHGVASTWIKNNIKKGSKITISNGVVKVGAVVSTTVTPSSLKSGQKVQLSKAALYGTSTTATKSSAITGIYYIWDNSVVNNRVRVTNSSANVGKAGQITGWVKVSDVKNVTTATKTTTSSTVLEIGDKVKLVSGAKYTSGASIPTWLFNTTLYLRDKQGNNAVISTLKTGAITGVVALSSLKKA